MTVKKKTRAQLQSEIAALQVLLAAIPFPVKKGDTVYVRATVYSIDPGSSSGEVCVEFPAAPIGDTISFWVNLDQLKLES